MLQKFNKNHENNQVKLNFTSEDLAHQIRNVSDGKYDFKILKNFSRNDHQRAKGLDNLKVIDLPSDQNHMFTLFLRKTKRLTKVCQ